MIDNKFIAYCGLNCKKCEAYLATINNDDNLRKEVALKWSKMNGIEIKPDFINCEGCRQNGKKTPFCDSLCEIRKCAIKSNKLTCGKCTKLDSCEKIKMIISNNKEALKRLKTQDIKYLTFKNFEEIYAWFKENSLTQKEMFCEVKRGDPKKAGNKLPYIDAVNAALCFGWIDSTLRNIDGVLVQRFSPRSKSSHWTELNITRCKELNQKGLMSEQGKKACPINLD